MNKITVGRDTGCDIVIQDPEKIVSRTHAELERQGEGYYYHDLSANGSVVNGRIIKGEKVFLTAGSSVRLAGKIPLPWEKVTALMSPAEINNRTNFKADIDSYASPVDYKDKGIIDWYLDVFRKYAVFSGRSRRNEYWSFMLINTIIALVYIGMLFFGAYISSGDESVFNGIQMITNVLYYGYGIASLVPGLAVTIRRLHDIGKSGWWYLIGLIPFVGSIVLIVFFCKDSEPGSNEYGPNPKQ